MLPYGQILLFRFDYLPNFFCDVGLEMVSQVEDFALFRPEAPLPLLPSPVSAEELSN